MEELYNLPITEDRVTEERVREIIDSYLIAIKNSNIASVLNVLLAIPILLKANSGTAITDNAINLDTFDISGFTAKDSLSIEVTISAITAASGVVSLYNNTDSGKLIALRHGGTIAAGNSEKAICTLQQEQQSATTIFATTIYSTGAGVITGVAFGTGIGIILNGDGISTAVTTSWQAPWTLALRMDAGTAGGTIRWSWKIYKIQGQ